MSESTNKPTYRMSDRMLQQHREKQFMTGLGRIPPQALDMEQAVLGALLLEKDAFDKVAGILGEQDFYKDAHQAIFMAIATLATNGDPVDILTVRNVLSKAELLEKAGGVFYLTELTSRMASAANVEYHARVIRQKSMLRQMAKEGARLIEDAYSESTDPFLAAPESGTRLFGIVDQFVGEGINTANVGYIEAHYQSLERRKLQALNGECMGITTGSRELDKMLGGLMDTDLIILAARPSMGKTAKMLTMAVAAARAVGPVAIASLEQGAGQLMDRKLSIETGIPLEVLRNGRLTDEHWVILNNAVSKLLKSPILIDDRGGVQLQLLCAQIRIWVKKHKVKVVFIDYLQLINNTKAENNRSNREQLIAESSRTLKALAKELNIPIVLLSQLSRAVETRSDKRPMLSDLRESGAIEQDADTVLFLYRPEYYGVTVDEQGRSTIGIVEVIVAKQRNGPVGTVYERFNAPLTRFENLTDYTYRDPDQPGLFQNNQGAQSPGTDMLFNNQNQ